MCGQPPDGRAVLRPVRPRDRRRSVSGVEAHARRSTAVLQREVRVLCAEPLRGRGAGPARLADVPVGAGHHGRHPVQRHRGAAGHSAVRGSAASRPAPSTAVPGVHAAPDAGGRGAGTRILYPCTGSAARRRRFRLRHRPRRVHADADDRLSARHSRGRPAADPRPQRQDHHRRRRARRPERRRSSRTRSRCSPSTSNGAPRTRRTT